MTSRGEKADKIIQVLDTKFKLNTREYNLIRDSIIDTCIIFEKEIGSCGECEFWMNKEWCNRLDNEPNTEPNFFCAEFEPKAMK